MVQRTGYKKNVYENLMQEIIQNTEKERNKKNKRKKELNLYES